MNLDTVTDKIKLFEAAGANTHAYDTAIPQEWFDQLMRMGFDCPAAYFVTDCGKTFPKLRHVGEAFTSIIQLRREANMEFVMMLVAEDYNNPFLEMLRDNHEMMDEVQSGMVNIQILVAAFNAGCSHAIKQIP